MSKLSFRFNRGALAVAMLTLLVGTSFAAGPYEYNIDANQSQLNLTASGSVLGGVLNVSEQHANAPTKFDGNIMATFPDTPRPGGSIRFPGGGAAEGQNLRGGFFNLELGVTPGINGAGGTAPANYGLTFDAPLGGIDLPSIPLPPELGGINLALGTLSSVEINLALRDVVWDVSQNVPGGKAAIDAVGDFNAAGGIQLQLASGFADVSGALVLTQDNAIAAGILELGLGTLVGLLPDLGLSVSRPNIFSSEVHLGIGTRLDLSVLGGNLALANGALDPGNVTFNELTGASTLRLPIDISLGDLGIPTEILDLQLGFSGQLVAHGTVAVPEPTSVTVLTCAAVGCVGFRRRRRIAA